MWLLGLGHGHVYYDFTLILKFTGLSQCSSLNDQLAYDSHSHLALSVSRRFGVVIQSILGLESYQNLLLP